MARKQKGETRAAVYKRARELKKKSCPPISKMTKKQLQSFVGSPAPKQAPKPARAMQTSTAQAPPKTTTKRRITPIAIEKSTPSPAFANVAPAKTTKRRITPTAVSAAVTPASATLPKASTPREALFAVAPGLKTAANLTQALYDRVVKRQGIYGNKDWEDVVDWDKL
jgi:hypothetical protein